jgi:predicted Zn-dependent protease with MMP-like domain
MKLPPSEFSVLVEQALQSIPEPFSGYLADIVVDVEPKPDSETLKELDLKDAEDLLGLYLGTPMTERGVDEMPMLPDRIVIYQRNIESICETRDEIIVEVRRTVLHEVGHHFGMDEDELDELGFG